MRVMSLARLFGIALPAAFAAGHAFAATATLSVPSAPPALARPAPPAIRLGNDERQRLDGLKAAHLNRKAQLTQENISDLDFIVERARRTLGPSPGGNLMAAATRSVNATVPGLSAAESEAIANYVLAEIASQPETQMNFNLQYLQLQSQMQNQSRAYSTLSNIMKTKHDTVKNSISNIR